MPAEVAKAILRDGSAVVPPPGRDARDLATVAWRLAQGGSSSWELWYAAIEDADTRTLIAAMAALVEIGPSASRHVAFREAARAMVEQKLTEQMVAKMEDLERVTARLERRALLVGVVGLVLAVVGTVAAVVSVWRMQ